MHRLALLTPRLTVRVLTRHFLGASEFDRRQELDIRRSGTPGITSRSNAGSNAWLNSSALREAARFRPDVVLSGHIVTSPAGWAIARAFGAPSVQYLHADEMRGRPRLAAFAVKHAAASVAVSNYTKGMAVEHGADPERVSVIPNGVDLPAAPLAERAAKPTVVTVARLEQRYKGHDVMIRAMPAICERVPGAEWLVVGEGSLRAELERSAAVRGLDGAVHFLGSLSDEDRDAVLDRAHVFAMPSRLPPEGTGGEGFGIVYLEAAAHGLPVVAGNVGGAPDAVVHGETGLLVDPEDPLAVADAVGELLAEREVAERLGRAGAERARGFAWPVIARQVEDLLLRVASPG